jgi:arabinose-5-phosphate isomerase
VILRTGREVLQAEAEAIRSLVERIGPSFEAAVKALASCRGRIVVSGMGKSGLIGAKIAATLASTGSPALFLHPAEAIHGDIGMVVPGDLVLGISTSGETEEMLRLAELLKRLGVPLLSLTGNLESPLARYSLVALDVAVAREAGEMGLVPTCSTTAALAMGDALAVAVLEAKGLTARQFASYHPGGSIGRKVLTVASLMHTGGDIPRVPESAAMVEAIQTMSEKKLGMTCVEDSSLRLAGVLTDGDLRRLLQKGWDLRQKRAGECMTRDPVTVGADELAARALHLMETRKITSLVVTDPERRIEGVIHIHDLWRTQLF